MSTAEHNRGTGGREHDDRDEDKQTMHLNTPLLGERLDPAFGHGATTHTSLGSVLLEAFRVYFVMTMPPAASACTFGTISTQVRPGAIDTVCPAESVNVVGSTSSFRCHVILTEVPLRST